MEKGNREEGEEEELKVRTKKYRRGWKWGETGATKKKE